MLPSAALFASGPTPIWEDSNVEGLIEAPNLTLVAVVVTAEPGVLSLVGVEPAVVPGGVTVPGTTGVVTIAGTIPTVALGGVTVSAVSGQLVLSGVEPSVSFGGVTVSTVPASLVLSGVDGVATVGPAVVFVQGEHAVLVLEGVEGVVVVGEQEPFLFVRLNPRGLRRTGLRAVPRYGRPARQMRLPHGVIG